jgi:DNA-binding XRE family transcriptional regulator
MTPIEELVRLVKSDFPSARCDLDPAETPIGSWFLDIAQGDSWVNVEWRSDRGFGITANREIEYGEGADETYPDLGSAARRVSWLLEHGGRTSPPLADQLRQMRTKRHLTQEELAKRLGVKQSSVSKLEGRGETASIRKLQELVAAMGGQLSLRVSFADSKADDEELMLGQLRTGTYG